MASSVPAAIVLLAFGTINRLGQRAEHHDSGWIDGDCWRAVQAAIEQDDPDQC